MKREGRLTKPREYAKVYSIGSSLPSRLLVLRILPNELSEFRYGLSVSKRVGNAVVRNRIRRRLKEIFRVESVQPGWDVVCIVRPPASSVSYQDLKKALEALLRKAGLMLTRENPVLGTGEEA